MEEASSHWRGLGGRGRVPAGRCRSHHNDRLGLLPSRPCDPACGARWGRDAPPRRWDSLLASGAFPNAQGVEQFESKMRAEPSSLVALAGRTPELPGTLFENPMAKHF